MNRGDYDDERIRRCAFSGWSRVIVIESGGLIFFDAKEPVISNVIWIVSWIDCVFGVWIFFDFLWTCA
jgi:hypothetical protein